MQNIAKARKSQNSRISIQASSALPKKCSFSAAQRPRAPRGENLHASGQKHHVWGNPEFHKKTKIAEFPPDMEIWARTVYALAPPPKAFRNDYKQTHRSCSIVTRAEGGGQHLHVSTPKLLKIRISRFVRLSPKSGVPPKVQCLARYMLFCPDNHCKHDLDDQT